MILSYSSYVLPSYCCSLVLMLTQYSWLGLLCPGPPVEPLTVIVWSYCKHCQTSRWEKLGAFHVLFIAGVSWVDPTQQALGDRHSVYRDDQR